MLMRASIERESLTDLVSMSGQTVDCTTAITKMTKKMAMVTTHGPLATNTKVSGNKVTNMVKVASRVHRVMQKLVFGAKAIGSNGFAQKACL